MPPIVAVETSNRDVPLGLVVDGVAQGGEAPALVRRGVHPVDAVGSDRHGA